MLIDKIKIINFKCFKNFELELNENLNVIVGNNESGKSTILEAFDLALTGMINGKSIYNDINQYIFNNEVVSEYLSSIMKNNYIQLPSIEIEIYFKGNEYASFEGTGNSDKQKRSGFCFKIEFDDFYNKEYEELLCKGEMKTLPIEYYDITWETFAREKITPRKIPIKSLIVDSSNSKYSNGSGMYISKIIKKNLEKSDIIGISQAHRRMKESFMEDESIKLINSKIKDQSKLSDKSIELSVELPTKSSWENSVVTQLDEIPFDYISKGEQCIVKTELALSNVKDDKMKLVMIEEPENHLSFSNLNRLINRIKENYKDKQIIISTHSSFVSNKLGLDNLIILENLKKIKMNDLSKSTKRFFEKIPGYDTLRMILCKKAILVEGDADELVVQKAYMMKNNNRLPIEDGIDVISVGTSFLRFLEIADKLEKNTVVVTDNDGNYEAICKKYEKYLFENAKNYIKICVDKQIDSGNFKVQDKGKEKDFNYNTLEPKLVKENGLENMNKILNTKYKTEDELHRYMKNNKSECALKLFLYNEVSEGGQKVEIKFPKYIMEAIDE